MEPTQKVIDPMVRRKFGRIINITSGSVKMPLVGLDLSSGARAGLTAFLAGIARSVAASNVTINFMLPGAFDTHRLRSNIEMNARQRGVSFEVAASSASRLCRPAASAIPANSATPALPVLRAGRLHHRAKFAARRRDVSGSVLRPYCLFLITVIISSMMWFGEYGHASELRTRRQVRTVR